MIRADSGDVAYNKHNYSKAFNIWKRKASQGNAYAQYSLGFLYRRGKGVHQSNKLAVKWYRKAAIQGYSNAQFNLGYMYEHGIGVAQSYELSAKWYKKAIRQGNKSASHRYQKVKRENARQRKLNLQKKKKARALLFRQAKQGNAVSQYKLSKRYKIGNGVKKSQKKSIKWLKKSAKNGYSFAQYELGKRYYLGGGVKKSPEDAVKWFKLSANQNNKRILQKLEKLISKHDIKFLFVIANLYAEADYINKALDYYYLNAQQDHQPSLRVIETKAYQDNKLAQDYLIRLYTQDKAGVQDANVLVSWLQANEKKDPNTIASMAWFYERGVGVKQDKEKAFSLFQNAARQGNARAQFELGVIYYESELENALLSSYMWIYLAKKSGVETRNALDIIVSELDASQLKQAKDYARRCERSHYKHCDEE
jgi:TPR repeat protein